jgi:hypothetical protein
LLKHDSDHLRNLDNNEKLRICQDLSQFLCKELARVNIDSGVIRETLNQAVSTMSYREALIYRDWQDAIGDAMLEFDADSVRRFKLIGYDQFERLIKSKSLWIEVFRSSINDINFDTVDPNDFRAEQLKSLAVAVSNILIGLYDSADKDLVDIDALDIAKKLSAMA